MTQGNLLQNTMIYVNRYLTLKIETLPYVNEVEWGYLNLHVFIGWYGIPNFQSYSTSLQTGTHRIESTPPWTEIESHTNSFTTTIPAGEQRYLVITNSEISSSVNFKGTTTSHDRFLNVVGLPPEIPYEITNFGGSVIATGVTSKTGVIDIRSDRELTIMTEPATTPPETTPATNAGFLYLYPDSIGYVGDFSRVVLDPRNNEYLHIEEFTDHEIFVPHAYIKIPVISDIEIDGMAYLADDGTSTFKVPYLDGEYVSGEAMYMPVLPEYDAANMESDGEAVALQYEDVVNTVGIHSFDGIVIDERISVGDHISLDDIDRDHWARPTFAKDNAGANRPSGPWNPIPENNVRLPTSLNANESTLLGIPISNTGAFTMILDIQGSLSSSSSSTMIHLGSPMPGSIQYYDRESPASGSGAVYLDVYRNGVHVPEKSKNIQPISLTCTEQVPVDQSQYNLKRIDENSVSCINSEFIKREVIKMNVSGGDYIEVVLTLSNSIETSGPNVDKYCYDYATHLKGLGSIPTTICSSNDNVRIYNGQFDGNLQATMLTTVHTG